MTTPKKICLGILSLILLSSAFASFSTMFPKEIVFFDKLSPNNEQTKLINNPEILFTSLGITTNTNISRARITIQAMPDCPENAPYQENVLQCFYISGFEFNDEQVSNTKISFKVPKQWMEENDYRKDELELRRYSYSWNENVHGKLSDWKPLITKLNKEDETYYHYTALSDGINYFSIVGNKKKINISEIPRIETPAITAQAIMLIPEKEEQPKKDLNFSWVPALFLFLTMILITFTSKLTEKEETSFSQLTDYVKNTESPEDTTRRILRLNGWEDWQINLAMNEAKKS